MSETDVPDTTPDDAAFIRHTVAALAYRTAKVLRDAPRDFHDFSVSPGTRTPSQILAHMGDLFDWALSMAQGRTAWCDATPQAWDVEVERFFTALTSFDEQLAHHAMDAGLAAKLFQGPIADALTHVGQLALLRRAAGQPIRGENYAKATITAGRTSLAQAPPNREFD
jgi:hypothetical protein